MEKIWPDVTSVFSRSTWSYSLEVASSSTLNMYHPKRKAVFQPSFFSKGELSNFGGVYHHWLSLILFWFILIPDIEAFRNAIVPPPPKKRTDVLRLFDHGGGVVLPPGGSSNTPASWCPWTRPGRGQEGFTQPAAGGPLVVWVAR